MSRHSISALFNENKLQKNDQDACAVVFGQVIWVMTSQLHVVVRNPHRSARKVFFLCAARAVSMLQRTVWRFQAARRIKTPHEILGVSAEMPLADIKTKYRELARLYHPDMPTGNPHLFREVTAAYNIIKTEAALGKKPAAAASSTASQRSARTRQSAAKAAQNSRDHHESEETLKREGSRGQRLYNQRYYVLDALWSRNGWEHLSTLGMVFLLGVWSADTMLFTRKPGHYKVHGFDNLSKEQQQPAQRFTPLPPVEPAAGGEAATADAQRVAQPQASLPRHLRPLKEQLRAGSNRDQHFTTLRDFLFEHDVEGADVRRATVTRFPVDRMDEDSVVQQCPHNRVFNSDRRDMGYAATVVDNLVEALDVTPWASPDAGNAAMLVANALATVVTVSPSANKWTIVEYRDTVANHPTTECLFAVRNDKYQLKPTSSSLPHSRTIATIVPMAQRIIISGSSALAYPPSAERLEALEHKKGSQAVKGGVVRMKDVSF